MKQSAAKTLGVAAVGVAIAAVGAGTANAAPSVPNTAQALDQVSKTVPAETVDKALPGTGSTIAQTRPAAVAGAAAAQPAAEQAMRQGPTSPVGKLLGGLPLLKGLPLG
ncbi:ATP-binding protein [Streptomyces sp. NPDC046915]|uniref:ATP-binding protein n=1 Tax=Streptomyces sp. NPDC046915 TaxID=3155257 RepID=UPI0033D18695